LQEDPKVPAMPKINPDPQKKNRTSRKLLAFLFVFFIVVLIILFFQSSLSKISAIEIEGNELLSTNAIGQASQIAIGEHYFALSSKNTEAHIISGLKMVKEAKVTKHFPGTIHIQVQEYPRVAYQFNVEGKREAVLADGAAILLPPGEFPLDKPILTGWSDNDPNKAKLCQVLGEIPSNALSDISEIIPDASDVYPDKIKIFTRSQYEVYTTIAYLPDKIDNLPAYIASLKENNVTNGIIKMLEVDNHAPFDSINDNNDGKATNANSEKNSTASPSPTSNVNKEGGKPTPKETPKPTAKPTPKVTTKVS
jgi:cell division protein FtsQ